MSELYAIIFFFICGAFFITMWYLNHQVAAPVVLEESEKCKTCSVESCDVKLNMVTNEGEK